MGGQFPTYCLGLAYLVFLLMPLQPAGFRGGGGCVVSGLGAKVCGLGFHNRGLNKFLYFFFFFFFGGGGGGPCFGSSIMTMPQNLILMSQAPIFRVFSSRMLPAVSCFTWVQILRL